MTAAPLEIKYQPVQSDDNLFTFRLGYREYVLVTCPPHYSRTEYSASAKKEGSPRTSIICLICCLAATLPNTPQQDQLIKSSVKAGPCG